MLSPSLSLFPNNRADTKLLSYLLSYLSKLKTDVSEAEAGAAAETGPAILL